MQHSPDWSGWLKRLADRRDPWRFFATGSSATALRHGGQDAGLGRWREMTLFPWSFREHVHFRESHRASEILRSLDTFAQEHGLSAADVARTPVALPAWIAREFDDILVDYLVLGGFPEVLEQADSREAQRHLRQDILDRALGRDVVDVESVDTRALERLFQRICQNPGGLWNVSEVAKDLQLARPTVTRYLDILVRAFLVFAFPNLASSVKGQPKVYLVAPSLRSALLHVDHERMRAPETWGPAVENLVAATLTSARDTAAQVGFWRKDSHEVDGVIRHPRETELVEVKTGSVKGAPMALQRAARAMGLDPATTHATVLVRDPALCGPLGVPGFAQARTMHVTQWLWSWQQAFGGTVRS